MSEPAPALSVGGSAAGNYLTFLLGEEEYGIPITAVREIIGMLPITPVPSSPPEMDGVINLRGKVIPVMSARRRFGLPPTEPHPHNVILVVEGGPDGVLGLSVDQVKEVVAFAAADVEPPPANQHSAGGIVLAIGKSQGRIRILLDVGKLLAA
jgi:purine-binding chemotaxis protein CheW